MVKILKKEHEILKPLAEKPWQKLTFKQIEQGSKKKSKSYVFKTLKKFSKEGIIKEENAAPAVSGCGQRTRKL